MRTLALLLCASLVLGACDSGAQVPARFCKAWEKAAKSGQRYEEVLFAAVEAAKPTGEWLRVMESMVNVSTGNHLEMLRRSAAEQKTSFTCDAYEFPAGRPTGKAVVRLEDWETVQALAADEQGVFWLSCGRVGRNDECRLSTLEGDQPKVLARQLPTTASYAGLFPDGDRVLLGLRSGLYAVPRAGGEPKLITKVLSSVTVLTRTGGALVAGGSSGVWRIPEDGGEPTLIAPLTHPEAVVARGDEYVVVQWQDAMYRAKPGATPLRVDDAGSVYANAVRDGLVYHLRSGKKGQALVAYSPVTNETTSIAEAGDAAVLAATPRGLAAVDARDNWPGKQRITSWSPGAAAFVEVARGVGSVRGLAGDARRVYWHDEFRRAIYAAPYPAK